MCSNGSLSHHEIAQLSTCCFAAVFTSCHLSLWERSRREPRERVLFVIDEVKWFALIKVALSRPLSRPTSPEGRDEGRERRDFEDAL